MYLWYKFITYLLYPFSNFYLFFRKLRSKEHTIRYKEKLSKIKVSRGEGVLIWIHVASVGEAMSILPLIDDFERKNNFDRILITTITLSSGKVLEKKFISNKKIVHQFLPLDITIFINKFLKHWSPNLAIFIESEIWPNLILKIKEKNIPLLLINGRITKKTFKRWHLVKKFAKKIFEKFDLCIASNKETEIYLKNLGAKNIKNYGNLKFAKTNSNLSNKLDILALKKIESRKIWVAASTHSGEEIFCAKTHLEIKKKYNNVLTIIIPRHIDRIKKIEKELSSLNLKTVKYTNIDQIELDTDILIVNTYGEALKFYNISKCVFLGKSTIPSLIDNSGQNPVEPSRLGCKIFHGPYINNFLEIYDYLKDLGITKQVTNPEMLSQLLLQEFENDKVIDNLIIDKIEKYGQSTLSNVLEEIKIYIKK